MKVLLLDIETAPNVAYVWGLWDQNISHDQLVESSYVLCWSAKWLGSDEVYFASCQKQSSKKMLKDIHKLLDEADVVIHYYGTKFDIPVLNREFVKHGFLPPSPYKQVDLKLHVARVFKFESNKLDSVSKDLELGSKVKHAGFKLWVGCMEGNPESWAKMEEYNRGDVVLLEKLYNRLRPWIEKHPSYSSHNDLECCPKCGGQRLQKRGTALAVTRRYQRYQCLDCGGWCRGTKALEGKSGSRLANIAA